jgi:hypothetical protein
MRQLSATGQQAVNDLARRHGVSFDAAATMLEAVINGNGAMAQFSHPEFGGSGQWMRGGMTMVGDMFNNGLKSRVDSLCYDLSLLVASQPGLIQAESFQSQNQGAPQGGWSTNQQQQTGAGPVGPVSLFMPPPGGARHGNWWPADLGWPNSTGAQNNVRYAYFAESRRLAIDVNGTVTIYDTLDNQIGGFSQQQSYGGSLTFSSQYGLVDVASLPVVSENSMPPKQPPPVATQNGASSGVEADIFGTIQKLGDLRSKGLLTEDEFNAKKAELLGRL